MIYPSFFIWSCVLAHIFITNITWWYVTLTSEWVDLNDPTYQHHNRWINSHWAREMHICIIKLTIIGSDNGLSPGRHQAMICTNAGILLISLLGTNSTDILIEVHIFLLKTMHLKISSWKCWPFCIGLNVLNDSHLGDAAVNFNQGFSNSIQDTLSIFYENALFMQVLFFNLWNKRSKPYLINAIIQKTGVSHV